MARAPKNTDTGVVESPVRLQAVKARKYLVIFSNGCKAVVNADKLPVYKFQMDKPGPAKVKVIEIEEVA